MEHAKDLIEISRNPISYARSLKSSGRKVIGYFCSYMPEEIIHAAGLHPLRLFGTRGDTSPADKHLQSYCCSLVRGALTESMEGNLDFLDGTVFPHTCDSIQRLSDIWRLNTDHGFFADVVLPVKLTTQSARQYMIDVMARFRGDLERYFGRPISDSDLAKSIAHYNRIRSLLREIYVMRSKDPSVFPGSDLCSLMKASVTVDRDILPKILEDLTADLKAKTPAQGPKGKRLMLVGGVCDHPDIHSIIERSGGSVVWDDLCTGTRYFEGLIEEGKDPITAIADRYFERQICPAKHKSVTARGDRIVDEAREHGIDGVIFLYLKFCDPHSFDYPYIKESLDGAQIPSMLLEIEDQLPPEAQLLTRLETFIQML